jgi:hypothetical protein
VVFAQYGCQFGTHGVYTTLVWSFLSRCCMTAKRPRVSRRSLAS